MNRDKFQMWIVWRLPNWIIKWSFIRVMAHATQGKYSNTEVPALGGMDAYKRWCDDNQVSL